MLLSGAHGRDRFPTSEVYHADIASWLARLGLDKYIEAFTANEVDFDALRHLTEDDLVSWAYPSARVARFWRRFPHWTTTPCRPRVPFRSGVSGACTRGRAAAVDRDVHRPRGLDRAVAAARSGGHARRHSRLSERGVGGDRPLRRAGRQTHGRRGARLFRLAAGA